MNRLGLLFAFGISLACSDTFARELPPSSKMQAAINNIQDNFAMQKSLDKNPLAGLDFQELSSRGYLYYYSALGSWLESQGHDGSNKRKSVDAALQSLTLAKASPIFDFERVEALQNTLLKLKIELAWQSKDYSTILSTIEKLSLQEQNDSRYVLLYGVALFNTNQEAAFRRLVQQNFKTFNDVILVQNTLHEIPSWTPILAQIQPEKEKPSKKAPQAYNASQSKLLAEPSISLAYLHKDSYRTDAPKIFKSASQLYFSLLKKKPLSSEEKKFLHTFEKSMRSFSPNFLDELITTHWKRRDLAIAENLSLAYLGQYQGHPSYPKVLYNLGRIQEDQKLYEKALRSYQKLLLNSDDATYAELARFRTAWVSYLAKKSKNVATLFADYISQHPDGRYASTAEYFQIQLNASKLSKEQNVASARKFINSYPLNFYSVLLMDDWQLQDDALLNSFSQQATLQLLQKTYSTFRADIFILTRLKAYNELIEIGLKEDAAKVLKSIPTNESNDLLSIYIAAEFEKLDHANGQESTLLKIVNSQPQLRKQLPWKGLFPAYNVDLVRKQLAEQKSTLSPFLILSIIRQESAFDPNALSTANATGLMQLTAGTAKLTANMLQLKTYDLRKPEDNLKLGIKNFSEMLARFNYRLDYALSAYNAGEAVTRFWVDLRGHLDPIAFIESIPYQETRLYVKNILRNYAVYRMLYEKRPEPLVSYTLTEAKAG